MESYDINSFWGQDVYLSSGITLQKLPVYFDQEFVVPLYHKADSLSVWKIWKSHHLLLPDGTFLCPFYQAALISLWRCCSMYANNNDGSVFCCIGTSAEFKTLHFIVLNVLLMTRLHPILKGEKNSLLLTRSLTKKDYMCPQNLSFGTFCLSPGNRHTLRI